MKEVNRFCCAALLLVLGSACAASSPYMKKGIEFAPASKDKARVVFLRPSGMAFAIAATILDEKGGFMGDSTAGSRYAVDIPAGHYMFIAWGEGTHSLTADLAPGKTYYVEVSPHMGAWAARFHLTAIKPSTEAWGHLKQWMAETTPHAVDMQGGQDYVERRRADAQDAITKGVARFKEYNTAEAAERTLSPEDGT